MVGLLPEDFSDTTQRIISDSDQRVYFVPFRWWSDGQDASTSLSEGTNGVLYTATPGTSYAGPMKLINNIFSSDLSFNLRREEAVQNGRNGEVGVSGRDYALVSADMWLRALKRHSNSKAVAKSSKTFTASEDDMADVYPLQLRLSVLREMDSLGVKISKKDNQVELFRRACRIFSVEIEQLRIWDYSGQIEFLFANDRNSLQKDSPRQPDNEILLELQIYGLSDTIKCKDGKRDDMLVENSASSSNMSNGSASSVRIHNVALFGRSGEAGSLGLTGLQNLGNTCFMNSAVQCLAHTPKIIDYFLGDYVREINNDNPLGMDIQGDASFVQGEIASAFGDLLRKLWAPGAGPVAPRTFKSKLARFAPQFSGFNQHDSQELLAFLLDGLHEDLNRVKSKPYAEVKDADDRPHEEVADEYWRNHLARNDSIIVDICQGQYKSTLVCPVCRKVSVTFDPFMYLSLPLPSTTVRTMTLTVIRSDGSAQPSPCTITIPKYGEFEDLTRALSVACSLRADEILLVAEIYNNRIIRLLEDPTDSLSLIRDDDCLVAYRISKDPDNDSMVVFMHQQMDEQKIHGKLTTSWKTVGAPLVTRLSNVVNGSDIRDLYMKLLNPFRVPSEEALDGCCTTESDIVDDSQSGGIIYPDSNGVADSCGKMLVDTISDGELMFYITDEKGSIKETEIAMNEAVPETLPSRRLNVLVCWPSKHVKQYDTRPLSFLPQIYKPYMFAKKPRESVSLYKCLEAFLMEEPLGPEDMWYCPGCKMHRQASKKLDLWRLPEILVIHLKRFSYSQFMKNKLETFVDFPIDDLDLSNYIGHRNCQSSYRYMLYAVSNHYGSMGGGHYTAFVHHGGNQWYDFDDSHVHPIGQEKIKSSAAYLLFYRRVAD